jgi:hypothetical protein
MRSGKVPFERNAALLQAEAAVDGPPVKLRASGRRAD